jgi:cytochrome c-type biogenesis protein CcmH/NrfG
MASHPSETDNTGSAWRPEVVYGMAFVCLILGVLVGYLVRGSASSPIVSTESAGRNVASAASGAPQPTPTLDQVKQLAERQVRPVLDELKKDPENENLLIRAAYLYKSTHQFSEAASYFAKALAIDPKNVSARTEMASCLYYGGDVDGALAQLNQSLRYDPKDVNSLFNLGMIQWKGKNDAASAIATWQELLRRHPDLDRRITVEQMIAEARQRANVN